MGRGFGDLMGGDGDRIRDPLGSFFFPGRLRQKPWEADVRLWIRWGMFTDAISYRRICRLPQSLRTKKLAVWGSCFVPGEPPMNRPFRELCAGRNRGKFGHEKYHKRLENIADNAGAQGTVAWLAPHARLAEIQQKRTSLQIPAQSRNFYVQGECVVVVGHVEHKCRD